MYRLDLLNTADPTKDVGKLIALTATAGFFGVFFVIPLRRYFIVHQKLTFPTPAATVCLYLRHYYYIKTCIDYSLIQAYTIRSLHRGATGALSAKKKAKALLWTFVIIFIYKVMTGYAPGVVCMSFWLFPRQTDRL